MNNKLLITDMIAFAEVATAQSYTQAAKKLRQSKAATSQQVKRLEKTLDEQLLIRNTRGMSLTASGERLLRRCEIIRDQFDLARKEVQEHKEEPTGKFAITCPIACEKDIVIPTLHRLCIEYPKLEPVVHATDTVKDLIQDGFDVALYIGPLKNTHYRALKIGEVHEQFYASKDYLNQYGSPETLKELEHHRCITLPWHEKGMLLTGDPLIQPTQTVLPTSIHSNNLSGAIAMAIRGMGIIFLPSMTTKSLVQTGELTPVLPDIHGMPSQVHLIHRYPSGKPEHLERFYQLIKLHFGQLN